MKNANGQNLLNFVVIEKKVFGMFTPIVIFSILNTNHFN